MESIQLHKDCLLLWIIGLSLPIYNKMLLAYRFIKFFFNANNDGYDRNCYLTKLIINI